MKKHKIKTMQDATDIITRENLPRFLKDFEGFLMSYIIMAELLEALDTFSKEKEKTKIKTIGFTWIDDGKDNINVNIKPLKK